MDHPISTGNAAIRYMVAGGILFLMMEVAVVLPAQRMAVLVTGITLALFVAATAALRHCPFVEAWHVAQRS